MEEGAVASTRIQGGGAQIFSDFLSYAAETLPPFHPSEIWICTSSRQWHDSEVISMSGQCYLSEALAHSIFPNSSRLHKSLTIQVSARKGYDRGDALPLASSGDEQFVKHLTPLRPGSSPLDASGLHIKADLILLEVATYLFPWTTHISEQPFNGSRCRKCLKSVRNEHEDGNRMRGGRRQRTTQDLTA